MILIDFGGMKVARQQICFQLIEVNGSSVTKKLRKKTTEKSKLNSE